MEQSLKRFFCLFVCLFVLSSEQNMSHPSHKKFKKLKIKKKLLREGRVSEGSSYRESTVQKAFSPYIAVSCNNIGKVKCGITASAGVTRIHPSFFPSGKKAKIATQQT